MPSVLASLYGLEAEVGHRRHLECGFVSGRLEYNELFAVIVGLLSLYLWVALHTSNPSSREADCDHGGHCVIYGGALQLAGSGCLHRD